MTNFGTSYFRSHAAAVAYYAHQEGDEAAGAVDEAIEAGRLHIGRPAVPAGASLLEDRDGRYHLQVLDPTIKPRRIMWTLLPSWYALDLHDGTEHRVGSEALPSAYPATHARYAAACGTDPRRMSGCLSGAASGRPPCPRCADAIQELRKEYGSLAMPEDEPRRCLGFYGLPCGAPLEDEQTECGACPA